jgi:hypothetical protein
VIGMVAADSVDRKRKAGDVVKATKEVLVDDLDGSEGAQTVWIGWNGDWREVDLSTRNLASLSRALDRYWNVGRAVADGDRSGRPRRATTPSRPAGANRDPKSIRAWATENGIPVPGRGRIPGEVERRYNEANRRS